MELSKTENRARMELGYAVLCFGNAAHHLRIVLNEGWDALTEDERHYVSDALEKAEEMGRKIHYDGGLWRLNNG
jgi:bacterioferritin (cytochrome b1)